MKSRTKKAIDIVLFPPGNIMDIVIDLSRRANERGENPVLNNKTDRLPHITLLMGCVTDTQEQDVADKIDGISRQFLPLALSLIDQDPRGGLSVEKTAALLHLHETLIKEIGGLLTYDCDINCLMEDSDHQSSERTIKFLHHFNSFITAHSRDNYWPHITTHNVKQEADISLPVSFTANRLALCHMGDHGTCRKILFETKLSA